MLPNTQQALILSLDNEIKALTQDKIELQAAFSEIQVNLNQQIEQNEQLQNQIYDYEVQIKETTDLLTKARDQSQTHLNLISQLKIQVSELQTQIDNRREAQKNSEKALSQAVIELNKNKQIIKQTDVQYQNSILMQKLHFLTEETGIQKQLIADYENTIESLKSQVRDVEMKKIELETAYELLIQKSAQQDAGMKQYQSYINKLIDQEPIYISQLNSINISDVFQEETDGSKKDGQKTVKKSPELEKLQFQLEFTEKQFKTVTERNDELIKERDQLKARILEVNTALDSKINQIKEFQAENQLLQKQISSQEKLYQDQIAQLMRFSENQGPLNVPELINQYKDFVVEQQNKQQDFAKEYFKQQLSRQAHIQAPLPSNDEFYNEQIQQQKDIILDLQQQVKEKDQQVLLLNKQQMQSNLDTQLLRQQNNQIQAKIKGLNDEIQILKDKLQQQKEKYKGILRQKDNDSQIIIRKYQNILQKVCGNGSINKYLACQNQQKEKLYDEINGLLNKLSNPILPSTITPDPEKVKMYENVLKKNEQQQVKKK